MLQQFLVLTQNRLSTGDRRQAAGRQASQEGAAGQREPHRPQVQAADVEAHVKATQQAQDGCQAANPQLIRPFQHFMVGVCQALAARHKFPTMVLSRLITRVVTTVKQHWTFHEELLWYDASFLCEVLWALKWWTNCTEH